MPTTGPPLPAALRRHPGWWALWLFSRLPFWVLYRVADMVAFILFRVVRYRRQVVRENLAKSFPEKSEKERRYIEQRFYRNLADVMVETIKLCSVKISKVERRVRTIGTDELMRYLSQGQTVLSMGSHMANWEWLLPTANAVVPGYQAAGVYRPLASPFAEALLTYIRTRWGARLIRMQDVGRDVVRNRATPRALSMIADQTPPGGEIQFFTNFLHQDTPFFVGGDKLAAAFRMPVFFFAMRRVRRGYYEVTARLLYDGVEPLPAPPKHVTDDPRLHPITEAYARMLEEEVRRAPSDYLWSHRRWKNSRPQTPAPQPSSRESA